MALLCHRHPAVLHIEPGSLGTGPPLDWSAGTVVGVPRLALESEERRDPSVGFREPKQKATIMPYAIVAGMAAGARIALVHVYVMNAAIGFELECLVRRILGPPGLAKGEDHCGRITLSPLHMRIDQIVE